MLLTPKNLMQLAAVVETGSFARAAALLNTSQPAISREIKQIEARLGAQLFDRLVRPAQPSELCLSLAEEGFSILFATQQASRKAEMIRTGVSGTIRLVGPPFLMDHIITPLVASFQQKFPKVEVQMQHGYVAEAHSLVSRQKVDLAVCAVELFETSEDVIFRSILPARNVIACRQDHPLLRSPNLQLREILNYGWVAAPVNSPLNQDLEHMLLTLGVPSFEIRFRSTTSASIQNYIKSTDCLAMLPETVVVEMQKNTRITRLMLELPNPTRTIGLLRRKGQTRTKLVDNFRQYLERGLIGLRKTEQE